MGRGLLWVGLAALANIKFAGGATAFGAMLSSLGGGLVVGTLVVNSLHARFSFERSIRWLMSGLGIGLTLLGLVPNVIWACVLMAAIGITSGYLQVLVSTWLQTKSDPQMRGRVMSLFSMMIVGMAPFGSLLAGWAADHFGAPLVVAIGGGFCALAGVVLARQLPLSDRGQELIGP